MVTLALSFLSSLGHTKIYILRNVSFICLLLGFFGHNGSKWAPKLRYLFKLHLLCFGESIQVLGVSL